MWKYIQKQHNLHHVFIDFKKAFGRVWHAVLWATILKYNISANLVRTNELLYDKATIAVQMNGNTEEWASTAVGVRQGSLLSPTLFNIYFRTDHVWCDALEEHDGKISTGGENISSINLWFTSGKDALAEEEQELEVLFERQTAPVAFRGINIKGQKLSSVTKLKYLGTDLRWWLKARISLKSWTSYCSSCKG